MHEARDVKRSMGLETQSTLGTRLVALGTDRGTKHYARGTRPMHCALSTRHVALGLAIWH